MKIPAVLRAPTLADDGTILRSLFLDLTLYLNDFTEDQLALVIAWYQRVCPPGRIRKYKVQELVTWDEVANPLFLTKTGRDAASRGERMPFLAAVRRRINEGRRFYVQLWDGASANTWSLSVRAPHYKDLGVRPFLRLVAPLDAVAEFPEFATELAGMLALHSGHGGLAFGYNSLFLDEAFDDIYAGARRFWGVDVEHLNGTMRAVNPGIKGVSWITVLGPDLVSEEVTAELASRSELSVERRAGGLVIRIGDEPHVGDQNRPDQGFEPYFRLAASLEPLYIDDHEDFPGVFEDNGNTVAWVRRLIDPDDWR